MHDSERRPTNAHRRQFLHATLGALGGAALANQAGAGSRTVFGRDDETPESETDEPNSQSASLIAPGDMLLFQGDSITDAGRDRKQGLPLNSQPSLGNGYAWIAAAGLLVTRPDDELKIHNRGIGGNKTFQLADRWDKDCLELEPDVLSILIGVNDIWHARTGRNDGTAESYEAEYNALMERTREALPNTKLIICEPFVLKCGNVDDTWFPDFDGYRAAARRVADTHGATFVAFQSMFDRAIRHAPPKHWAKDGVHPSPAGVALMAQMWLNAVGG